MGKGKYKESEYKAARESIKDTGIKFDAYSRDVLNSSGGDVLIIPKHSTMPSSD